MKRITIIFLCLGIAIVAATGASAKSRRTSKIDGAKAEKMVSDFYFKYWNLSLAGNESQLKILCKQNCTSKFYKQWLKERSFKEHDVWDIVLDIADCSVAEGYVSNITSVKYAGDNKVKVCYVVAHRSDNTNLNCECLVVLTVVGGKYKISNNLQKSTYDGKYYSVMYHHCGKN